MCGVLNANYGPWSLFKTFGNKVVIFSIALNINHGGW